MSVSAGITFLEEKVDLAGDVCGRMLFYIMNPSETNPFILTYDNICLIGNQIDEIFTKLMLIFLNYSILIPFLLFIGIVMVIRFFLYLVGIFCSCISIGILLLILFSPLMFFVFLANIYFISIK